VQNAIPHPGFYVIRVHHLTGSFSPVPEGHTETVARVLQGSFAMLGSQIREGN